MVKNCPGYMNMSPAVQESYDSLSKSQQAHTRCYHLGRCDECVQYPVQMAEQPKYEQLELPFDRGNM